MTQIPANGRLLGSTSYMSGEIVYYYYEVDGQYWSLCDWTGSIPQPMTEDEIAKWGMR